MNRRTVRFLATVILLGTVLISASSPLRAQTSEPQFGAAAVVLSQSGKIGGYGLAEPPGYPGARCRYDAADFGGDGAVSLAYITYPTATAHTDYGSQLVSVKAKAYQKLADGSLQFVLAAGAINTVVSSTPTIMYPNPLVLAAGPTYVLVYEFVWYNPSTPEVIEGWVNVAYTSYRPSIIDPPQVFPNTSVCASVWPPYVHAPSTTGTVNSTFTYMLHRYPLNVTVQIRWDGTSIGTVHTGNWATAFSTLKIPAAPMGLHKLTFTYGTWSSTINYTVKPRIKLIPSTVARDQTVNVSLRGFAKNETVRIRWKQGSSWVQIAQVTTSGTGSANINVKVPKFALDGPASVRGDGNKGGAAQTNAVTVAGGPMSASTAKTPTPTPTPSPTATSVPSPTATTEATVTSVPAEPTSEPTAPPGASPVAEPSTT